jgi:peptidoglycan/xylan/chitin deacetylase (PgdA/CDA1 family)
MTSRGILIASVVALAALGPRPAVAEDPASRPASSPDLLHQCWTPDALAGTDEELKPSRSRAGYNLEALKQEVLSAPTPVPEALRGSIRSVVLPPGEKLIALTFDLCETDADRAGYDGRIVDLLRAEGVKATFFAGGKWLETHPERAAQLIADPNLEIGSHGLLHRDLSRANDKTMEEEIRLTEAAYDQARKSLLTRQCAANVAGPPDSAPPEHITVMRFPYGRCNAKSLAAVADAGELAIQWDVVTGDPDPHVSAKAIVNTILAHAHPGAIIVAHANGRGRNTAAALAVALPKLKQEGYRFVTVSELVAAGKPVIAAKCYLNRPGDEPRRVARLNSRRGNDIWKLLGFGH